MNGPTHLLVSMLTGGWDDEHTSTHLGCGCHWRILWLVV